MKIKDCIAFAKCVRNPGSPLIVDAQTVHRESSTCAYHQNEELSSKDEDFPQIKEISLQTMHCNSLDDIWAVPKSGAKFVEIPDDVYQKLIEYALRTGHRDDPGERGPIGSKSLSGFSIELEGCVNGT